MSENTKQVIVLRRELRMRRGKECSQCAHASMAFLTKEGSMKKSPEWYNIKFPGHYTFTGRPVNIQLGEEINHWLENSFRKIVCGVKSEEELVALHQKALDAGLMSHLITDNGATEFNGVPTITALSIGPHFDSKFIGITDHLPLL